MLTIINFYEVEPTARGARIRHAFEVSGPLALVTRLVGLRRVYRRQLDLEVAAVVQIAASPDDTDHGGREVARVSLPERAWHGLVKSRADVQGVGESRAIG